MEDLTPMEVWWPVVGNIYFKGELIMIIPLGEYEGSNIGRVRCLNYGGIKGNVQVLRQHYLQGGKIENDWLRTGVFGKDMFVHTIIALAFIGERPKGFEVDHINFRRDDNRLENIRYIPKAENCCRHSADGIQNHKEAMDKLWSDDEFREKQSKTMFIRNQQTDIQVKASIGIQKYWSDDSNRKFQSDLLKRLWEDDAFIKKHQSATKKAKSKKILQIDKNNGEVVKVWNSMVEASNELGITNKTISQCCLGQKPSAGGYIWAFAEMFETEEYFEKIKTDIERSKRSTRPRPVIEYDLKGNFVKKYNTIKEASKQTGINDAHISLCCKGKRKTAGKRIWRYA